MDDGGGALSSACIPNYFSDEQRAQLERDPQFRKYPKCPVCSNQRSYWYKGERTECPDDDYGHIAMRLFKLYCLANIPLQYMKLDWADFRHKEEQTRIDAYMADFAKNRAEGLGWVIYGAGMGTGKTFAATHMLRECVKMGYEGWFADFMEIKNYSDLADARERDFKLAKVRESDVLVLDEIRPAYSERAKMFYAEKLEEIVRFRTNLNLVTFTTTNMVGAELIEQYRRVHSLLSAKQHSMELVGFDARTDLVYDSLAGMEGVSPIT